MYLFMAFEARPAFKWSLAAWCKAPSSIGPSRSLGVLAISDISVGTGEAEPPVLVVPAEATDQVLCPIDSDLSKDYSFVYLCSYYILEAYF